MEQIALEVSAECNIRKANRDYVEFAGSLKRQNSAPRFENIMTSVLLDETCDL